MNASDLGEGIVPDELPRHVPPTPGLRKDFKPWHRVRKQFIRERQWNEQVHTLAKRHLRRDLQKEETKWGESGEQGGETAAPPPEEVRIERPLRCLLIPGDDLLDVRSLWGELQSEGFYITFLGFNNTVSSDERRRQMDVAESAVTQLSKVCKRSHVIGDSFQNIGRENTQAYHYFRQYGPYDVVNLDMCDTLVPRGRQGEMDANFTAIHRLLAYQVANQKEPWLLFVTTQVEHETAHQEEIDKLAKHTRNNSDLYKGFSEALAKLIPAAAYEGKEHALDISKCAPEHLIQVFGVVLGKWLMSILASASPRCSIRLLPSYRYVIKGPVEMLSLSYLITPHYASPIDTSGVSSLKPSTPAIPTEAESAVDLATKAAAIGQVDNLLMADQQLRDQLANRKAKLLAAAGYDSDAYLKWVADGERDADK